MKKNIIALVIFFYANVAFGATSVTQNGITFTWTEDSTTGTFANGDPWVVGPITITSITPDAATIDGRYSNGWDVNPMPTDSTQHFQQGCENGVFSLTGAPTLPYVAAAGSSVIKTTVKNPWSTDPGASCLNDAVVLTVLAEAPPDNGVNAFRPPYIGTSKPLFYTTDIRTSLLPSVAAPSGVTPPTLSSVESRFQRLQLDYLNLQNGRGLRPANNIRDNYGPQVAKDLNDGILRLFLNDSYEDKKQALIYILQYMIDFYYVYTTGGTFYPRSGHDGMFWNHVALFGVLLGDESSKTNIAAIKGTSYPWGTHEVRYLHHTQPDNQNIGMWGIWWQYGIPNYWNNVCNTTSNYSTADPYGYIDAGPTNRLTYDSYQIITFSTYKYAALIAYMMPEIYNIINPVWPRYYGYVERMVTDGRRSDAEYDPCAPCQGTYGVDYGTDSETGDCIKGSGRNPSSSNPSPLHSSYYTTFQEAMWTTYHDTYYPPSTTTTPTIPGGVTISGGMVR